MLTRWKLNTNQKTEIIALFKEGWKILHIAHKFHIDHSTVIYHLKKNKIKRHLQPKIPRIVYNQIIIPIQPRVDFDGSKLNEGKSYKNYLEEEARRKMSHAGIILTKH